MGAYPIVTSVAIAITLAVVVTPPGGLLGARYAEAAGFSIGNVITSAADVGKGVIADTSNLLPTANGLFESGKQLIAGYPFEFVSDSINKICSSALSSKTLRSRIDPDISNMNFQLRTACDKLNFPLLKAERMWDSPAFDPKKKVVILATGWTTTINETEAIDVIAKAYICRGDINFVALDAASFVDTLYTWSALNTELIGENVARGLLKLLKIVPIENIHLIGHSLGAHIVGAAGRYLSYMTDGKAMIPRITGLDPAKPCFNEGEALSGLLRGDAQFIDVIHSNPGVLGKRDPIGDVDFYPGGLDPLPTGCVSVTCAHGRAWRYYAESVYPGQERNFLGKRCSSLTRLRENKCPNNEQPMGYAASKDLRGNYFLDVNEKFPFGQNASAVSKTQSSVQETCGLCPQKKE